MDDSDYETSEQFELVLADPSAHMRIGPLDKATAIIEGPNDGKGKTTNSLGIV